MNTAVVATTSMSNPFFKFQQFIVRHDRCAMKVGTDGVLLGAWAEPAVSIQPSAFSILDVGTGSGLVALMLAQRFPQAHIDAIDIDKSAIEQAAENFAASPWSDRLHTFHARFQDWQSHSVPSLERVKSSARSDARWSSVEQPREGFYSLIVSNPPYFQNSLKNPDKSRQTARHTDTLTYSELLQHSARLLSPEGTVALILPAEAETEACELARMAGLLPARITHVYSKENKPARRVLLAFVKPKYRYTDISTYRDSGNPVSEDNLVLENETGGRTAAYQEITKDFYL